MFHIDGLEEFGYNPINRYWYSFYLYMNTVKRVCSIYNYAPVNHLKGYVAHFCYIRLVCFDTFIKVIERNHDYVSANCLLRMLGDHVAVFRLVYGEKDENLRWLRHCLYVIDGCEQGMKVLPTDPINKGCMPDDELEIQMQQTLWNRGNRQRMMDQAWEIIDHLPLKQQDPEAIQKIIDDRNWKFKEFKSYKNKNENQYKWKDLYELIDETEFFDLLSFLSQYAHGLSMSNLIVNNKNSRLYDGVIGEAVGLLDRMNEYVLDFFKEEHDYIMLGLLESETRDKILSFFVEPYRQIEKAQWGR